MGKLLIELPDDALAKLELWALRNGLRSKTRAAQIIILTFLPRIHDELVQALEEMKNPSVMENYEKKIMDEVIHHTSPGSSRLSPLTDDEKRIIEENKRKFDEVADDERVRTDL
jgi:hypothetical protein